MFRAFFGMQILDLFFRVCVLRFEDGLPIDIGSAGIFYSTERVGVDLLAA